MIVTFRSDAGPLEGFLEASFRVAVNDDGVGSLTAPPEVVDAIEGFVECEVDGQVVFRWRPEDREATAGDDELVVLSGRGRASALERVVVLPVGYPAFTERTRTETGAPFAVFATLLAEGQARGRATDLAPSWTPSEDSKGDPWTENVDVRLEPGTTLRELLDSVAEVEGAEWIVRPNGDIDAAPELGDDRSGEVVLFYGADQVARERRSSTREQRQTVFIEASTGVSEATNTGDDDLGEIWLEAQDYADPLSRQTLADKLALKLGAPEEEATVAVAAESGPFVRFRPGDTVGLDTGSGTPEPVRVVGLAVSVTDEVEVTVDATLITEVALRQQRIERAIEAKADVQLAAAPSIQRRHGLVTADKFLSGAVGDAVSIASEDYVPGVSGWVIRGNGNAEFNDAVFRGDLQSDNYDPGLAGWALDRDGNAEFNDAVFRGDLQSDNYAPDVAGWALDRDGDSEFNEGKFRGLITGSAFTTNDGTGAGHVVISGNPALDPESPGLNEIAFIPDATFFPPGTYALPALIQVLDTGGMALASVAGSSGTDKTALLLRTNGIDLDAGPNGFQGIGISAPDGPIDLNPQSTVTVNGDLSVTGVLSGNGSGLTNLPATPLPSSIVISGEIRSTGNRVRGNSLRTDTSVFFATSTFPRFESTGASVQLRGTGNLRMKFDGGLDIEDGPLRLTGGTKFFEINQNNGNGNLGTISFETIVMEGGEPTVSGGTSNIRVPTFGAFQWQIRRITSSGRYKRDVVDAPLLDRLLDVVPRHYRGIEEVEVEGDGAPVYYGAIAEEVADLGLADLVEDGDDGPEALAYDRIGLALIPHVRALRDRVARLEEVIGGR